MHFFKKILLTAILLLPFITQAQTGELPDKSSTNETQELEQLLELLQEQTSIATKTRLNADYVPGMVTVLHGSDLEDRGVRTVWEALGLVPGVELSIEETGRKQVVVRGIGRTYASGNIQIQLNGASLNTAHIAHANPVMNIPIEQVERIEVIRGPGSAIHGEFALAGVLNVITHKEESKIFVNGGENSSLGAGFMVSYNDEQSPLQMNLNIAGWETDGPDIIAGPDELYYEGPSYIAVSNAPGPTNEMAEDKTAIFSLSYEDFSFTAHLLKEGYGDHFGRNQYLPPDEKRIVTRNEYKTLEIKQNLNINNNWNAELYVGWQEKKQTKDDLYAGPELHYPPDPPPDPSIFYHVDTLYIEKRNNIGVDIKWSDKASHNVLVGFEYVDITVEDELNEYYRSDTNTLIFPWDWIDTDKRRRIISTTLQDEYLIRNDLTITLGLRHDEYNDIDSEISPRIAAVWRKDQNNIYKAQYARAFRPPTFYEMAAAIGDVEGTNIETYELGYIYKNNNSEFRLTLFNSHVDSLAIFVDTTGFTNDSATLNGIELELTYKLSKTVNIDSNFSLLDSKDNNTGEPMPGSSDWIANIGLNIQPNSNTNLSIQFHAISEFYREAADTRSMLDGYNTTDFTLSIKDMFERDLSFRFGIKNLFNKDVRYPAPELTYIDDHPRAGSQWWMQLSYEF